MKARMGLTYVKPHMITVWAVATRFELGIEMLQALTPSAVINVTCIALNWFLARKV